MRILDLFCCQGGAGAGYSAAGFSVVGVDLFPQPRYPFEFIQADAIEYALAHGNEFDFIHASPPCQRYSMTQRIRCNEHPDLLGPTRQALQSSGRPWVIENVESARPELVNPVTLCGLLFGLNTYRHRLFESGGGLLLPQPEHVAHLRATTKMGRTLNEGDMYHAVGNFSGVEYVRRDLRVPWMSRDGIRECIPPAYTHWVGTQMARQWD